jgi:hypothetical protein
VTAVKMHAEGTSEMSIPVSQTTRRHIFEDHYLNIDYREGLKSQLHYVCVDARQLGRTRFVCETKLEVEYAFHKLIMYLMCSA